jgi:molecular chaperone DnaK
MSENPPVPLRIKLPFSSEGEFLAHFSSSLARGGVFVATSAPKPVGTRIAFQITLVDGAPVLAGRGTVIERRLPLEAKRPGMTLRFSELDAKSRSVVDRAVELCKGHAAAQPPARPPAPVRESSRSGPARQGRPAQGSSPARGGPIVGIDLGATNSRAAVFAGGAVHHFALEGSSTALPSVVAFDERGRILLGSRAKAQILIEPGSAIFGAKRLLGRRASSPRALEMAAHFPYDVAADASGDAAIRVRGELLSPQKVAAHLLAEIRSRASEAMGQPVERAILGVPAYFNDRQRRAARVAGELAGLAVERVLSEPLAVGIAFGRGRSLPRKRLFVYDLGGGTFDASVLEATGDDFDVLATGGDSFLGGLDFDERLAQWLERRFCEEQGIALGEDPLARQRILGAAESAKIALSSQDQVRVLVPCLASRGSAPVDLDLTVDRARLDELIRDLVERTLGVCRAVLEARSLSPEGIDEVLAVGGQSLSPQVRRSLEGALGRPARADLDPTGAVAAGAALLGHALREGGSGLFSFHLTEVLSAPIGIGLQGGRFARVLDRNTRLPVEKSYTVAKAPGAPLKLAVYQGDADQVEENEYLGALTLDAPGYGELAVVFSLSPDGVLTLSAGAPDGYEAACSFATAEAPPEVRASLLASAPLPPAEPDPGFLEGLRRLFRR